MRAHENDNGSVELSRRGRGARAELPDDAPRGRELVVDLSRTHGLDFASLSLLLTAQQMAAGGDRVVWLAGLSPESWKGLRALGLAHFFRLFPGRFEVRA